MKKRRVLRKWHAKEPSNETTKGKWGRLQEDQRSNHNSSSQSELCVKGACIDEQAPGLTEPPNQLRKSLNKNHLKPPKKVTHTHPSHATKRSPKSIKFQTHEKPLSSIPFNIPNNEPSMNECMTQRQVPRSENQREETSTKAEPSTWGSLSGVESVSSKTLKRLVRSGHQATNQGK